MIFQYLSDIQNPLLFMQLYIVRIEGADIIARIPLQHIVNKCNDIWIRDQIWNVVSKVNDNGCSSQITPKNWKSKRI